MVFPGQGSQRVGMLKELAEQYPIIQQTFRSASEVLNEDLWRLTQDGPESKLNQTQFTQPALLTASVALWRVWQERQGPMPHYLAGHSLGEYTALVCNQALKFTNAVQLVAKRGELMQEAVPLGTGAMGVILGLSDNEVMQICLESAASDNLSVANFNCPGQVVIAGNHAAVERALLLAKEQGASLTKLLPVSVPSHCILMEPAAREMAKILQNIEISSPTIPFINNVDVKIYHQANEIKDALVRQLYSPVRWTESIQWLLKKDCHLFLECGPEKILSGLNKRIDRTAICLPMSTPDAINNALIQIATIEGHV